MFAHIISLGNSTFAIRHAIQPIQIDDRRPFKVNVSMSTLALTNVMDLLRDTPPLTFTYSAMGFEQQYAPSLTPELWARVFAFLSPMPGQVRLCDNDDDLALKQNQLEVLQLKLMCKPFRDIYATYPGLVQQVYISSTFSGGSLLSLLAWLQQNKSSVQAFQSANGNWLEALLAGLVMSGQPIKILDIIDNSACSLSLVAAFTRLEECALTNNNAHGLDLTPLRVLPSLTNLILSGSFRQLHQLTGLTRLVCIRAWVSERQAFAPMLQHLEFQTSSLSGINTQGLSACTALTQLVWRNALMQDSNQEWYLDSALSVVPTDIGLLTQLHTLDLSIGPRAEFSPILEWLTELISLQELRVNFCRCDVIHHALLLTQLTCLKVLGQPDWVRELPFVHLEGEWHRLQALQELCICQLILQLGKGFAGLLQVECLRQISFAGNTFYSVEDGCLAAVIHVFGRLRPQVKLIHEF